MTLRLVNAPTTEPVTVAEVKLDLRIDESEFDTQLAMLITAFRKRAEDITGRALMPQTWELLLDKFPAVADIAIGLLPITAVTSLKYYDTNGVLQTLDASNYELDKDTLPGWINQTEAGQWPSVRSQKNSVIALLAAGYEDAAAVPSEFKYWIRLQVQKAFTAGSHLVAGSTPAKIEDDTLNSMLDAYKVGPL